jgi:cytochrome oxidase Cu insertion factor (SCO1/SenC/PrrC family)
MRRALATFARRTSCAQQLRHATTGDRQQQQNAAGSRRFGRAFGMGCGALIFPATVVVLVRNEQGRPEFDGDNTMAGSQRGELRKGDAAGDAAPAEGDAAPAGKPVLGGPFEMLDCRLNRVVNEKQLFSGSWSLLYFGFTKCSVICPNTLKFVTEVMRQCDEGEGDMADVRGGNVQCCFVSVDPVRDNRDTINAFLKKYRGDSMVGLTGSEAQIEKICKAWRVYYSSAVETEEEEALRRATPGAPATLRAAIAADDTYQFDHSSAVYLVGPDGKLKDFFFTEMGAKHAVSRMALHFNDAYGINT